MRGVHEQAAEPDGDFATHLRGLGFDAQPLGNADQLELGLAFKLGRE